MCLLLATLPVDVAVCVTFLFVDGSFWNSTSLLPAWLDAEVLQDEHRSNKHRPVVNSCCCGSASDNEPESEALVLYYDSVIFRVYSADEVPENSPNSVTFWGRTFALFSN